MAGAKRSATAAKRPRIKAPAIRREQLMDTGERLLLAKGIASTSIDDIVAAANVAKGTFYLYFASKEALLTALRERFVSSFCELTQAAMDRHRPESYAARLRSWLEAAIDGYFTSQALHDLVFHQFTPDHRHTMSENPLVNQLADLLRAGTAARAWSAPNPQMTATMIFFSLHGAVDVAAADPSTDRKRFKRTAVKFCEAAVGKP